MAAVDNILKSNVPYYSTMKRGIKMTPKEHKPRKKRNEKHYTLTEYSQNGSKPILKEHTTVNQAARKLYEYENTGLSPHEVQILIEREKALTRRVEKLEGWEQWATAGSYMTR